VSDTDDNTPIYSGADYIANGLSQFLGANYRPGKVSSASDKEAFHGRFNHRIESTGIRLQENLEAVFAFAFAAADTPGTTNVDDDWLARFISYAELISDDHMRRIWGFLLACEFETPGSVSLSSLQCISNMTQADIELWEKVGRITFSEGYVFKVGGRNQFERFGLNKDDVVHIQTLGLLQEAQDLSVTFGGAERGLTFAYRGAEIVLRNPDLNMFTLPAFKLTSAGLELFNLLIDDPVDEDYLRAFGTELKPNGYDYRIRLADGSLVQ
jgi:hypothetical protein